MCEFLGLYPRLVWFAPLVLGKGRTANGLRWTRIVRTVGSGEGEGDGARAMTDFRHLIPWRLGVDRFPAPGVSPVTVESGWGRTQQMRTDPMALDGPDSTGEN